jgi:FkbM family methyltransferase
VPSKRGSATMLYRLAQADAWEMVQSTRCPSRRALESLSRNHRTSAPHSTLHQNSALSFPIISISPHKLIDDRVLGLFGTVIAATVLPRIRLRKSFLWGVRDLQRQCADLTQELERGEVLYALYQNQVPSPCASGGTPKVSIWKIRGRGDRLRSMAGRTSLGTIQVGNPGLDEILSEGFLFVRNSSKMKTKHFFDVGGNIGQTFDWLATLPHDYSDHMMWIFEPSPRHYAKLIEKCKEKSGRYKIKLCPFGLGGKNETVTFFEKDDTKGDSFEPWLKSDHEVTNVSFGYEVVASVISLPEFILRVTEPGDAVVLDIDAEGSEYPMLEALVKNEEALGRVTEIIVEFHHIKNPARFMSKDALRAAIGKRPIKLLMRGFA